MACSLKERALFVLKARHPGFRSRLVRWIVALSLFPFVFGAAAALCKTIVLLESDPSVWVGGLCGIASWLICFWRLPKPMWIYVAGHELTHALAGLLCGAIPRSIKIKSTGGKVELPRTNIFITLAPYLVPLYTLAWCLVVWIIHQTLSVRVSSFWISFGVGLTYAFHLTLTVYILRLRQPDFVSEGEFLSLVLTVLGNLFFVLVVLGCLGSRLTVGGELTALGRETLHGIQWLVHSISSP